MPEFMYTHHTCRFCSKRFVGRTKNKSPEFCGTKCRKLCAVGAALKLCLGCKKSFVALADGDHCTKRCRREHRPVPKKKADTGTIGAVGELLVSIRLMREGYAIFRALSPSSPCDLIAAHGATTLRVEVTKATRCSTGKVFYAKHDPARYDLLALWFEDGTVEFRPPLPEPSPLTRIVTAVNSAPPS